MEKVIYVLDDDPAIRTVLSSILKREKCLVSVFSTVRSLQVALTKRIPDLFLLDVNLPDGNGINLAEQLMEEDKTRKPIVMISANEFKKSSPHSALIHYFKKPFDLLEITEVVLRLLH